MDDKYVPKDLFASDKFLGEATNDVPADVDVGIDIDVDENNDDALFLYEIWEHLSGLL